MSPADSAVNWGPNGDGDDPRFNVVLVLDVAAALEKHGYPSIRSQGDTTGGLFLELQDALFGFIRAAAEKEGSSHG